MNTGNTNVYPFNIGGWWCYSCQRWHNQGDNPHAYQWIQPDPGLPWPYTETTTTTSALKWKVANIKYDTFDDAIKALAYELAEMVITKQRDYGTHNILDAPGGAENGILIRLWDKMSRLKNLVINKKDPQNESVQDTYRDIAGYALVAMMVSQGYFELPLKEED